tara:strand:+ start:16 stop:807 length:792 start_codon:yes stop_codon:yes gene_type:complete
MSKTTQSKQVTKIWKFTDSDEHVKVKTTLEQFLNVLYDYSDTTKLVGETSDGKTKTLKLATIQFNTRIVASEGGNSKAFMKFRNATDAWNNEPEFTFVVNAKSWRKAIAEDQTTKFLVGALIDQSIKVLLAVNGLQFKNADGKNNANVINLQSVFGVMNADKRSIESVANAKLDKFLARADVLEMVAVLRKLLQPTTKETDDNTDDKPKKFGVSCADKNCDFNEIFGKKIFSEDTRDIVEKYFNGTDDQFCGHVITLDSIETN